MDPLPASLSTPSVPPPAEGGTVEIAPGVLWARMPLPFALDHVNLWLLADGAGWTLVDTGLADARTRANWQLLFETALDGRPIVRIIATHFHPDHVGLAGWLAERWDASFHASRTEWLLGRMLCLDTSRELAAAAARFYVRAGLDADVRTALGEQGNAYARRVVPLPPSLDRLQDGDRLAIGGREWQVIVGSGHSPEHVCLHAAEDGLLIAGDQVLPRISPNVSVWVSEPAADPLGDFLATLDRLRRLPAATFVLPSHGLPFRGLHQRLDELADHHRERLEQTSERCAEPATVAEVMRVLFRRGLDTHQISFAVGEALAHLNHLVVTGRLSRTLGSDGVQRFARR